MKAARTPPLSTAAAITEPKLKLDCDGRGPHCSCTRSGRLSAAAHLSQTQICDGQRRSFASEENVEQMRSAVGRQAALNHGFREGDPTPGARHAGGPECPLEEEEDERYAMKSWPRIS
ncbi:hypothetical protein G5714_022026 [Onychostoma macrolepis]|uniref:Uncharacterized protein n=1 Tax=Onychostoma macrolepis TaxID=369639 RepID=A0A7J6BSS7_9TELE|nr:hypothetical protein G5714_022026 [Onychostoma macrolepis]